MCWYKQKRTGTQNFTKGDGKRTGLKFQVKRKGLVGSDISKKGVNQNLTNNRYMN